MENKQSLDYADVKAELSALRGDINNLDRLITRLDTAIDKISNVASDVNKMLAVHDNRLETHSMRIDHLVDSDKDRRIENDKKMQEILDKIAQMREDMRTYISASNKEMNEQFHGKLEELSEEVADIRDDVTAIQNWKWLVIGASAVAGWMISKMGWVLSIM